MSKGHNSKKGGKKEAVRTLQEKRIAKREKKNGPISSGLIDQIKK